MRANALAEARAPQLVITAFVEALHNDDMAYLMRYVDLDKIRSQPKHGYTAATLKTLFSDIQMSEIDGLVRSHVVHSGSR